MNLCIFCDNEAEENEIICNKCIEEYKEIGINVVKNSENQ